MARRSRRGSSRVHSWRDVFTLAVLDTREHEEQPLAHSMSFSVEQTDGAIGHLRPPGAAQGHRRHGSPHPPTFVQRLQQCPAGGLTQHRWDCARKANSSTVEQPRLTSHQSNSSTTNITVLKGTTPPCSVPMLYVNLHSLRPVQVHDSH